MRLGRYVGVESAFLTHLHECEMINYQRVNCQSLPAPCPCSYRKYPQEVERGQLPGRLPQDYQVSPSVSRTITSSLASECIALNSLQC